MYKSPLHILRDWDLESSEISDRAQLLRFRKRLFAEFNLSDSITIDINGKVYTKDEVIKTMDQLLDSPDMPLHLFIYSNKQLLEFLEDDNSQLAPVLIKTINVPEEFRAGLHPLLLERFIYRFKRAISQREFLRCRELLQNLPPFDDSQKNELFESIGKSLLNLKGYIESYRENSLVQMASGLDFLKNEHFSFFLNDLPGEFKETINSLVAEIINTMVAYDKMHDYDNYYLYKVSIMLTKVECDESLMDLIKNNHKFYSNIKKELKSKNSPNFSYTYIIAMAFIAILRFCVSSNSHSTFERNSNLPYYASSNNLEILNGRGENKTPYQDFVDYRYYVFNVGTNNTVLKYQAEQVQMDSNISGKSPFHYILKSNLAVSMPDSVKTEIIIHNKTGFQLILFSFDSAYAEASYFYNNLPEKFYYEKGRKLCFYFGDTLSIPVGSDMFAPTAPDKQHYDVYFRTVSEPCVELLRNTYVLETKKINPKKRRNRNKSTPTLVLEPGFIKTGKLDSKEIILRQLPEILNYNF